MAENESNVKILSWPEKPVSLEHQFNLEEPFPISLFFEKTPANVIIHTTQKEPLNVNMAMNIIAKETIPLCVKLCEPICAESEYTIKINIFDKPVGTFIIRGLTKLFASP